MTAPVRGWVSKSGSRLGLEVMTEPSRRDFCGLGEGQAAQVVSRLGRLAARRKECPLIRLQELNPVGDVARVPDIAIKAKFCAQEGGAQLRNQLLGGIVSGAKTIFQISIKARLMTRPVQNFMKCNVVEVICT